MIIARATGRPLRFAGVILGGWILMRVLILWSQTGNLPHAIRHGVPGGTMVEQLVTPTAAAGLRMPTPLSARPAISRTAALPPLPDLALAIIPAPFLNIGGTAPRAVDPARLHMASLALAQFGAPVPVIATSTQRLSADGQASSRPPSGLSGSAWTMVRGGNGRAAAGQGQLGGAQAGARLRHPLPGSALTAMAGVNLPLAAPGREAVAGLEWRPLDAPVTLIAEQRVPIDGTGTAATGAGAVAGFGPHPLAHGLSIEAYGQAGAVLRDRVEPYADGAARALRPVGGGVALGGGIWGGAQRDAARLDIGPSAVATVRMGDQPVRIALDWRQRVAGDAAPDSGPALTIGLDF